MYISNNEYNKIFIVLRIIKIILIELDSPPYPPPSYFCLMLCGLAVIDKNSPSMVLFLNFKHSGRGGVITPYRIEEILP